MKKIANDFYIPEEYFLKCTSSDIPEKLAGLTRLNVLIGPNNAGKSRLLRSMFSAKQFAYLPDGPESNKYTEIANRCILAIQKVSAFKEAEGRRSQLEKIRQRVLDHRFTCNGWDTRAVKHTPTDRDEPHFPSTESILPHKFWTANEQFATDYNSYGRLAHAYSKVPEPDKSDQKSRIRRVYIPAIRGIRALDAVDSSVDLYCNLAIRDYQWKAELQEYIFTGQLMYSSIRSHLLGTLRERNQIRDFERFLGDTFFEGKSVTLIPSEKLKVLYIKVGNEVEREIHNWGDGIQHLMIMSYPLFVYSDQALMLFIEEPELYLHPGYQRIFIEQVLSHSGRDLQVFVATHSHQFLDITIDSKDCTVFRLTKAIGSRETEENDAIFSAEKISGSDKALLAELGVRNSSVMLSNCTIWVEGITDRLYYRHCLDILQKHLYSGAVKFAEDLHYSFVEYGGSNITHWSFLGEKGIRVDRLCSELLLIADGDGERKTARHELLRKSLGERFVLLDVKEVENLLSPQVLHATLESLERAKLPEVVFDDSVYGRIALGTYIESQLQAAGRTPRSKSKHPYADEYGAIKDKVEFCHAAIAHIHGVNDMSSAARSVSERMLEFISKHNS